MHHLTRQNVAKNSATALIAGITIYTIGVFSLSSSATYFYSKQDHLSLLTRTAFLSTVLFAIITQIPNAYRKLEHNIDLFLQDPKQAALEIAGISNILDIYHNLKSGINFSLQNLKQVSIKIAKTTAKYLGFSLISSAIVVAAHTSDPNSPRHYHFGNQSIFSEIISLNVCFVLMLPALQKMFRSFFTKCLQTNGSTK